MGNRVLQWLSGIWLVLAGISAVWPAWTRQTIPEWLAGIGMPVSVGGSLYGWLMLGIGAAILIMLLRNNLGKPASPERFHHTKWAKPDAKEAVFGHHFMNDSVDIDGKEFEECTFDSVTMNYHGTAPSKFTNCKVRNFLLQTDNQAVKGFLALAKGFRDAAAAGDVPVQIQTGAKDSRGRFVAWESGVIDPGNLAVTRQRHGFRTPRKPRKKDQKQETKP